MHPNPSLILLGDSGGVDLSASQQHQCCASGGSTARYNNFDNNCNLLFGDGDTGNNNAASTTSSNGKDPNALLEAEKFLSQNLYEMSLEERENVLEDVHGVSDGIEETPSFIFSKKQQLETEIQLPTYYKFEAFQTLWNEAPDFVRGMYILFLRTDLFDVKLAAERMMKHFDMKRMLFGVSKLGRDITLKEDFTKDDLDCIRTGFFQLLPARDRAGRTILSFVYYHLKYENVANVVKMIWLQQMVALKDVETQKKGQIVIIYNVCDKIGFDKLTQRLYEGVGSLIKASPIRIVALHYCFSNPAFGVLIKLASEIFDRDLRTRSRLHIGSHIETRYELMSYGIPVSAIPVTANGTLKVKEHRQWMKTMEIYEQQQPQNQNIVMIPSNNDVLFGRGTSNQNHHGNLKLGYIIEERAQEYIEAKRNEKGKYSICQQIVLQMKNDYGTRFLRQDNTNKSSFVWIEVNDETAIDKVGHGFRNRKKQAAAVVSTSSSTSTRDKKRAEKEKQSKKTTSTTTIQHDDRGQVVVQSYAKSKRIKI